MLRTAIVIMGDEAEARDAVQDALVAAWRQLSSLRDPGAFDAWLTRILVNRCRRGVRRRGVRRLHEVPVDAASDLASAARDDVVERNALERAFDRLSLDGWTLPVRHHLDGRPLASVAEVLGIPVGTAKSRLSKARLSLERALEREAAR